MVQKNYGSLLVLLGLMLVSQGAFAQRVQKPGEKKTEHSEKEPSALKSKLWYGGGVQLGFNSFYGSNVFSFGLSPMVGYKIIEQISVGPRVEMTYASVKQSGFKAVSLFDIDAGVFVRVKVFRGLFLQGELSNEWYQEALTGSADKYKSQRFNQRLGAGWNFGNGQGGGSEIGVFYNFAIANDVNAYENPLGYRFGFTWNF
jgi:hypothetical protein